MFLASIYNFKLYFTSSSGENDNDIKKILKSRIGRSLVWTGVAIPFKKTDKVGFSKEFVGFCHELIRQCFLFEGSYDIDS